MPADELTVMIDGLLHFFGNKEQRHGSLNAKTSILETVRLGIETAAHLNQKHYGESSHPAAAICEPLLTGEFSEVQQGLHKIAQSAPEVQFVEFCDTLADYGSVINDRSKRKRAGELLYILGTARVQAQIGPPPSQSPFSQWQQPSPRQAQRPYEIPYHGRAEPEHPNTPIFKPYIDLGRKAGTEQIAQDIEHYSLSDTESFHREFTQFAISLRDSEKLKTAFALSNKIYEIYAKKLFAARPRLPAPKRPN